MMIVRENTEGEYSSVGGRMFEGTDREFVLQEAIFTRTGVVTSAWKRWASTTPTSSMANTTSIS